MLRDKDVYVPKGAHADAVWAVDQEVKRHVVLGWHPNVVGLRDAGIFMQPPHRRRGKSELAQIGLVFDLHETGVRQFLKNYYFTLSGLRHVLNSVLEGLGFINDRGCIHCELKPANIFMRWGDTFARLL